MASMTTMTTTFLGGSTAALSKQPLPATTTTAATHRGLIAIRASSNSSETEKMAIKSQQDGRRDLVFGAVAAAAAISFARIALADEEPKRGTPEAKKKYGPICVTMPTARICRN